MIRKLPCKNVDFVEGEEILISIKREDVTGLVIELELLLYSKVDSLLLEDANTRKVFKFSVDDSSKKSYYIGESSEIILSRNNVEYIVSYMLTYVRDYTVEVNHVQFELLDIENGQYIYEFTLFLDI